MVKCPICGGPILAKRSCTEFWKFGINKNREIDLTDLVESVTISAKLVCGDCGRNIPLDLDIFNEAQGEL